MSSTPPTLVTQRLLRRIALNRPSSRSKKSPKTMNGMPSPRQYDSARVAALAFALWDLEQNGRASFLYQQFIQDGD
jgi:hypothetical protein